MMKGIALFSCSRRFADLLSGFFDAASAVQYEIPDGIRLLETSKRIQRRVAALALTYNIFGDEKYAQRGYAELEAACHFKDWNAFRECDIRMDDSGDKGRCEC